MCLLFATVHMGRPEDNFKSDLSRVNMCDWGTELMSQALGLVASACTLETYLWHQAV